MQQRARIASGRKAEGSDVACAPGVRQRARPGLTAWLTRLGGVAALALLGSCVSQAPAGSGPHAGGACRNVIHADVVAIEQAYVLNRFAAFVPAGMLYALRHDVVPADASRPLGPGNAMLRPDKRPRPLVLRVNEGDCLQVAFENLLDPQWEGVVHIIGWKAHETSVFSDLMLEVPPKVPPGLSALLLQLLKLIAQQGDNVH